jgi:hypothetical protein
MLMPFSRGSFVLYICIDFDGTIVEHEYPKIGKLVPNALRVISKLQENPEVRTILYTMRSGDRLEDAVEFCLKNGIKFWSVNENPSQNRWTTSPKVYGNIYIDDAALGCPLIYQDGIRPYVDWNAVEGILSNYL